MLAAHYAAVEERARAHTLLEEAEITRLARADTSTEVRANYLVLTVTLPGYAGDRLSSPQAVDGDYDLSVRWRVVAVDLDGLIDLSEAVREQFIGHALIVPGRAVSNFVCDPGEPERDRNTQLLFQDLYFDATTSRAV